MGVSSFVWRVPRFSTPELAPARSPGSALFLLWGRVPLLKWSTEKRNGTLILTSQIWRT